MKQRDRKFSSAFNIHVFHNLKAPKIQEKGIRET